MIYKKYNNNSYNLYTVKTDKFKTCEMHIIIYNNIDKDNITKEIVLQELLSYSTKKYKTKNELLTKLKDLYDINFNSYTSRVGNIRTINFNYSFLDPIYTDKNYLKEVIKIPFEMIFNPNINNKEFDNNTLNIIKNKIKYNIDNQKENILKYLIKECLKTSDKDGILSYDYIGNIKDLNKINNSNIYDFYEYLLDNYYIDIYLIGNLDMDKINIMINELFNNYIIKTNELNIYTKLNNNLTSEITIKDDYSQSILIMLYSLNNLNDKERFYTLNIFNNLLGGSSLSNKLSQHLRETNSMCYNINSYYDLCSNYLIIHTQIDKKNKSKAIRLINKALKEIQKGKFSDEEFNNLLMLYDNAINNSLDDPSIILNNYFYHNLINAPFLIDRKDNIDTITKQDIINLSKKIKLLTIYFMEGNNNERD